MGTRSAFAPWKQPVSGFAMARGKRPPEDVRTFVCELLLSGFAREDVPDVVVEELGFKMSRGPVDREAIELGIERTQGRPSADALRAKIAALDAQKMPARQIADALGLKLPNVYRYLRSMKTATDAEKS